MADRACMVLEDAYSTREFASGVALQGDRRFLVSGLVPTDSDSDVVLVPPDEQQDILVVFDPNEDSVSVELRIVEPPGRLAPGPTVIYYELHCRGA